MFKQGNFLCLLVVALFASNPATADSEYVSVYTKCWENVDMRKLNSEIVPKIMHRLEMNNATGFKNLKILGYRKMKFSPDSPLSVMQFSPIVTVVFSVKGDMGEIADGELEDEEGYSTFVFLAAEFDYEHTDGFGCNYSTDDTLGGIPLDASRNQRQILTKVMGEEWLDERKAEFRRYLVKQRVLEENS